MSLFQDCQVFADILSFLYHFYPHSAKTYIVDVSCVIKAIEWYAAQQCPT